MANSSQQEDARIKIEQVREEAQSELSQSQYVPRQLSKFDLVYKLSNLAIDQ